MKRYVKYLLIVPPLLLCAAAVCLSHNDPSRKQQEIPAATEEQRLTWLALQGHHAQMLDAEQITIPAELTGCYADYAALQEHLQLPLASYAGMDAVRITYEITGSDPQMYAELLTADGILIGAQCYLPEESITLTMQGRPYTAPPDVS